MYQGSKTLDDFLRTLCLSRKEWADHLIQVWKETGKKVDVRDDNGNKGFAARIDTGYTNNPEGPDAGPLPSKTINGVKVD